MRVIVGTTDRTQLASAHCALRHPPSAPLRAGHGRSTLQDAWAKRTVREWLTMPGSACFLQKARRLSPGKLKVANVLQPCSLHLLSWVFSCVRNNVSMHRHGVSEDCRAQGPAHCSGVTDHARQSVLLTESRTLAGEVERGERPAAFPLAPLAVCIDLHALMRQTAGTAHPRAKLLLARLVRGGTMSARLWSVQYSGGSPSRL